MTAIIVGSTALRHFGIYLRKQGDTDVWCESHDYHTYKNLKVDAHIKSKATIELLKDYSEGNIASPDAVLTIKASHLGYDVFWDKHYRDVTTLLHKGLKIIKPLFDRLYKEAIEEHGAKDFLSLDKKKESFFNDHVDYVYDHDYLHGLVAKDGVPTYTKCLRDDQEVMIDKAKFMAMSHEDQVSMAREEITTIAIERFMIPTKGKVSWVKAYPLALRKTFTTLTKGWFTEWMIYNAVSLQKPDYEYFREAYNQLEELKMSKLNNKQSLAFIEERIDPEDVSLSQVLGEMCEGADYSKDGIDFTHMHQEGGGEGEGEYCFGVFELDGKIFRAEYNYYSYEGTDYDYTTSSIREVSPVEKMVTVYE